MGLVRGNWRLECRWRVGEAFVIVRFGGMLGLRWSNDALVIGKLECGIGVGSVLLTSISEQMPQQSFTSIH